MNRRPDRLNDTSHSGPRVVTPAIRLKVTPENEAVQLGEQQPHIAAGEPIVVVTVDLIGVDDAGCGLGRPGRAGVAAGCNRIVQLRRRLLLAVHRREQPDVDPGELAREFDGSDRIDDAASVDQLIRAPRIVRRHRGRTAAFPGRTMPTGDRRSPGRHRLQPGRIRIRRAVERQVVGDTPPQVAAELRASCVIVPSRTSDPRGPVHPRGRFRIESSTRPR